MQSQPERLGRRRPLASPIGSALHPRNVTREFKALLVTGTPPDIRFHDLRHTAATLSLPGSAVGIGRKELPVPEEPVVR